VGFRLREWNLDRFFSPNIQLRGVSPLQKHPINVPLSSIADPKDSQQMTSWNKKHLTLENDKIWTSTPPSDYDMTFNGTTTYSVTWQRNGASSRWGVPTFLRQFLKVLMYLRHFHIIAVFSLIVGEFRRMGLLSKHGAWSCERGWGISAAGCTLSSPRKPARCCRYHRSVVSPLLASPECGCIGSDRLCRVVSLELSLPCGFLRYIKAIVMCVSRWDIVCDINRKYIGSFKKEYKVKHSFIQRLYT